MKKIITSLILMVGLVLGFTFSVIAETGFESNISDISKQAKQTVVENFTVSGAEAAKTQSPPDTVASLNASLKFAFVRKLDTDYTENLRKPGGFTNNYRRPPDVSGDFLQTNKCYSRGKPDNLLK